MVKPPLGASGPLRPPATTELPFFPDTFAKEMLETGKVSIDQLAVYWATILQRFASIISSVFVIFRSLWTGGTRKLEHARTASDRRSRFLSDLRSP